MRPFRSRPPFPRYPELVVIRVGAVLVELACIYRVVAVGFVRALPLLFLALGFRIVLRYAPRLYSERNRVSLP